MRTVAGGALAELNWEEEVGDGNAGNWQGTGQATFSTRTLGETDGKRRPKVFSNSSNKMRNGGSKRQSHANALPLILRLVRRKYGSSWELCIVSARRNTRKSSTGCARMGMERAAKIRAA